MKNEADDQLTKINKVIKSFNDFLQLKQIKNA